jgi:hypothetical protein
VVLYHGAVGFLIRVGIEDAFDDGPTVPSLGHVISSVSRLTSEW